MLLVTLGICVLFITFQFMIVLSDEKTTKTAINTALMQKFLNAISSSKTGHLFLEIFYQHFSLEELNPGDITVKPKILLACELFKTKGNNSSDACRSPRPIACRIKITLFMLMAEYIGNGHLWRACCGNNEATV